MDTLARQSIAATRTRATADHALVFALRLAAHIGENLAAHMDMLALQFTTATLTTTAVSALLLASNRGDPWISLHQDVLGLVSLDMLQALLEAGHSSIRRLGGEVNRGKIVRRALPNTMDSLARQSIAATRTRATADHALVFALRLAAHSGENLAAHMDMLALQSITATLTTTAVSALLLASNRGDPWISLHQDV